MKEIITNCDKCQKSAKSYMYANGCEMDPSGNGYNTNWEYIDLCSDCALNFMKEKKVKLKEDNYSFYR